MPDVGDTLTGRLKVADGDGTTGVALAVTDPRGIASAPSTSTADGGLNWTALVPLTEAGWWVLKWTVTGAGAGVATDRVYASPIATTPPAWPPTLAELKEDRQIDQADQRHDGELAQVLAAAVAYVQDVKAGQFNMGLFLDGEDELEPPDAAIRLGTLRLAGRWHDRRRSPDGMINAQEMGATRVTSGDSDIDRMLRLGRFAGFVFA